MGKRKPTTPRSQVRAALRLLWLRSRERAAALKRDGNVCQECGAKGSVAKGREVKTEVHHLDGIMWRHIEDYIYRHLLVDPKGLQTLCKECHKRITEEERERSKAFPPTG